MGSNYIRACALGHSVLRRVSVLSLGDTADVGVAVWYVIPESGLLKWSFIELRGSSHSMSRALVSVPPFILAPHV